MGIVEIILIGIGLSMDAVAVSASNGMCYFPKRLKVRNALVIALAFGVFQGIMPLIGFYAGSFFSETFSRFDHWIALVLLCIIGGKMVFEAVKGDDDSCEVEKNFTLKLLVIQAIATSVDALAVGVSFAAVSMNIWIAISIIAATTFLLSFGAVYIGKRFGTLLNKKAEILGGLILIGIGLKIFIEHSFFS